MNFKFDSSNKDIKYENNSNFYKNKDNNLDFLVKINTNLNNILSSKIPKYQVGLFYRHDQLNSLLNLNFTHIQSDPSKRLQNKTQDNKIKLGFIKKNTYEGIDAFYGTRINYIFQGPGNNLQFNNVKALAGVIHKDYALFINLTKNKNSVFPEKFKINGVIKLLPKVNLFGEFKKAKDDNNANFTTTSFGYQWEMNNNSEFKMKLVSHEKKCYFALKRNLNQNFEVNFIGSLGLKEISGDSYGSLASNIGLNITYTE
jgi:hypothetical protein